MTKRVHRKGSVREGPSEKVLQRRSDGESLLEKVHQRRCMPENMAHSRPNHGSDTIRNESRKIYYYFIE